VSAKLLIRFSNAMKMQIILKIFLSILEVKPLIYHFWFNLHLKMTILTEKWRFWPPKRSKLFLKQFASSRHQKTIPLTLKTPLLPLVLHIFKVHLWLCTFQSALNFQTFVFFKFWFPNLTWSQLLFLNTFRVRSPLTDKLHILMLLWMMFQFPRPLQ